MKTTALIKNRPYMLYITNIFLSYIGNRLTFLAIIQLMMYTEYKVFGVATVTLIRLLPIIVFSTAASKVSKKYKDSTILLLGDIIEGITVVLIVFFRNPIFVLGIFTINSIIDVFADVSGFSFYDKLLKREEVNSANSILRFVQSVVSIIGPIIAVIILSTFGMTVALIIDSLTFFIGAITTVIIKYYYKIKEDIVIKEESIEKKKSRKLKTLHYINQNYKLKYMFLILIITVLLTENQAPFMYVFGEEHLGVDISVSGMFISAIGVGSAIASLLLLKFDNLVLNLKLIFYSVIIDGIALIILSNSKNIIMAFLAFGIFGVTGSIFFVSMRNLIQLEVPSERISEVYAFRFSSTSLAKIISISIGAILVNKLITVTQLFMISGLIETFLAIIMLISLKNHMKKNELIISN